MSASAHLALAIPSDADATLAKETKRILVGRPDSTLALELRATNLARKRTIRIPASATRLLVQILDEMSRGNAVRLIPVRPELSAQEAANMLNISRPTLIRWLDEGKIEFRKVGTHRRVRLESVAAFKLQLDSERMAALAELTAYDQQLGI